MPFWTPRIAKESCRLHLTRRPLSQAPPCVWAEWQGPLGELAEREPWSQKVADASRARLLEGVPTLCKQWVLCASESGGDMRSAEERGGGGRPVPQRDKCSGTVESGYKMLPSPPQASALDCGNISSGHLLLQRRKGAFACVFSSDLCSCGREAVSGHQWSR